MRLMEPYRAGAHPHRATRISVGLLHELVAVVSVRQGQEEVKKAGVSVAGPRTPSCFFDIAILHPERMHYIRDGYISQAAGRFLC